MWNYGCYAAITNLIVLILVDIVILRDYYSGEVFNIIDKNAILQYFMYLVSLIVLCIAEGLNLVVTISLSYSTT